MNKLLIAVTLLFAANTYAQTIPSNVVNRFIKHSKITSLTHERAQELFDSAIQDPWIRMKDPGNGGRAGLCASRAKEFKNWLKNEHSIRSGSLQIYCGTDAIVGVDQVTKKTYRYANFHEANLVIIKNDDVKKLYVMDTQFSEGPILLDDYLSQTIQGSAYFHSTGYRDRPYEENDPCKWFVSSDELDSSDLE